MKIDPAKILLELYEADTDKCFDDPADEPIMGPPLVGVADAADPWFSHLKQVIGQFHWAPAEALATVAREVQARSVICWSMPISEVARKANRSEQSMPARTWAYARQFSTAFIARMATGLVGKLREMGYASMVPAQSPENDVAVRQGVGLASRWSERHVAFVAGLGTFGISGGLITAHGIAHRLGSVITDAEITPTPRPYGDDPFAWCLRTSKGTCGACIARCPVDSIGQSIDQRDKEACRKQYQLLKGLGAEAFGFEGTYGCGLCQTDVPCEGRIPGESA